MSSRPELLTFVAVAALALSPATASHAAEVPPVVDRSLYPGAHRLAEDSDLALFLGRWGHYYKPGMRLPLWAHRWVERNHPDAIRPIASRAQILNTTVGPNINATNDPSLINSESYIAVDRSNPRRLVAGSNQINDDPQMMYWTQDGGNSWGKVPMPLGNAQIHSDPGVAWDSKGVAYAVSLGIGMTTEIQVVRSVDGGQSWSDPPIVVSASDGNDKELLAANDQPGSMCQDLVCVAWNEVTAGPSTLYVACAPQGQGTWTTRAVATGDFIGAIPAFGPGGELYVAWSNIAGTSIDFVRSDDCGQSFSARAPVAQTRIGYDLGIPAMCRRRALVYPSIDVDRSSSPRRGWVFAVWTDAPPGVSCPTSCTTGCTSNVYFSRSEDGGTSWSAPITVHQDLATTDQFNPWLAVNDSDGSVNVMWYDTRGDATRKKTNVWFVRSPDGGTNWEPEVQVTTAVTDETTAGADAFNEYGDYNGLAAFQCGAWPIWTDRRTNGTEQIYTAAISTGIATAPPPDIGNTLMGVADAGRAPAFSWTDLNQGESNYAIYRGVDPDFDVVPPTPVGQSGGPDVTTWTDGATLTAPGVWFYRVRGLGPCGEEASTW